jgi:hypothetical protein
MVLRLRRLPGRPAARLPPAQLLFEDEQGGAHGSAHYRSFQNADEPVWSPVGNRTL